MLIILALEKLGVHIIFARIVDADVSVYFYELYANFNSFISLEIDCVDSL